MALAFEPDFLNVQPTRSQDPSARKAASTGTGEAFATRLSEARSRDAETDTPKAEPAEAGAAAFILPPPPPEAATPAPEPEAQVAAVASAPDTDTSLASDMTPEKEAAFTADPAEGSELETDRNLAAARVETAEAAPRDNPAVPAAAPAATEKPAAAPARVAAAEPAASPDAQANPAAPQDAAAADAPQPSTGETAVLAAAVAVPAEAKGAGTGKTRLPSITEAAAPGSAETAQTPAPAKAAASKADIAEATELASEMPDGDTVLAGPAVAADKAAPAETSGQSSPSTPAISLAAAAPAVQAAPAPASGAPVMVPTHGLISASPADVVDIVARSAADGQSDSIVVQLDPPELGRVSIDFKFDAQGLQHVTITGETPEAMRQLRLMHFELTQALERQGLGSHTMSFQQQQQNAQSSVPQQPRFPFGESDGSTGSNLAAPLVAADRSHIPRVLPGGRLDIRL